MRRLGHRDFANRCRRADILQRNRGRPWSFRVSELCGTGSFGPRTFLSEFPCLFDHGFDFRFDSVELRRCDRLLFDGVRSGSLNRTTLLPLFDVFTCPIGEVPHSFGMRSRSIGHAFNQRGTLTGTGSFDGLTSDTIDFDNVVAVDFQAGHPISDSTDSDTWVSGSVRKGNFRGELVVLTNKQHRQLPDTGHVQPFVKGSVIHGTVPEKRDRHVIGFHQFETVSTTTGLKYTRTNDAAGSHHPDFRREQVHAAPSPP